MKILAIETSCDETSVAVVEQTKKDGGVVVLSCVTATSMNMHATTGGIIPENAARKQVEYMLPTLEAALTKAFPAIEANDRKGLFSTIDAIAVTVGPGLIGSLLVGVETAKTLSMVFDKPLVPVNHIQAHIYTTFIGERLPSFPFLALVVSGGHTDFVQVTGHGEFKRLGGTRDDAAGEAFDKCARLIGLGYPGGPSISKAAQEFKNENPQVKLTLLPRPMKYQDTIDLSFSGLKTAVSRLVKINVETKQYSQKRLAAEINAAIVDSLIDKTIKAADSLNIQTVVLCGGVSANTALREGLKAVHLFESGEIALHVPELIYCTDNAAMIGSCALFNYHPVDISLITPNPELHF